MASDSGARLDLDGRRRVVVDGLRPQLDGGRFPIKRVVGDEIAVDADVVIDGHDLLAGRLLHRKQGAKEFQETELVPLGNDVWRASFVAKDVGVYEYTVEAWVDAFATFRHRLRKKHEAGQDVGVELLAGAKLVAAAAARAKNGDAKPLTARAKLMESRESLESRVRAALDDDLERMMRANPDRAFATRYDRTLQVIVDEPLARFSAWYEFFPRSTGAPGKHGTFRDAEARLPYVADMGFDVVYLPPIHPIGTAFRKGKNNSLTANKGEPGSPWAIGAKEGGHKATHPELGTLDDFDRFVKRANGLGLQVAIDVAFQVSPDHPYVKQHPEWFVHRADGTIQYAENPPKKYQDVYPFAFDGEAWKALWSELKSVFTFWLGHGVHVFRVDNPHTKPLPFWEWCIREVKAIEPRALFLAEAFTRPRLTYGLAKRGFTQSYTYFTWRTTKRELTDYLTELTKTEAKDFFRPNFWPNTPDILPEDLQHGGRPAFLQRLILAATMSSNYGIYGPAFELMEHVAREGTEEYVDNEKYELKQWELDRHDSLKPVIKRINQIRRENPALQRMEGMRFHETDNEMVLAYSKSSGDNTILTVVNLDHHHAHAANVTLDLEALGVRAGDTFQVHDLLGEERHRWSGDRAYVRLDPHTMPAHVFRIRRFARSEKSFEYYL